MEKNDIDLLIKKLTDLKTEIHKVIVGQDQTIDHLIIGLISGGHVLLEGVPGLAKTLMIRTLANAIDLSFKRIQFTPDLMPTDVLGTEILEEDHGTGKRVFKFNKGPIFANIVLADEINRTPPKTQAALLEAMQEYEVTYAGQTYGFDLPFFLLATQNPIEQAGTYPLPEAQLDRFLLYINLTYPSADEELDVLIRTTGTEMPDIKPVMSTSDVLALQKLVREVTIDRTLVEYVTEIVRATRPSETQIDGIKKFVRWGAGPRAGQSMILSAKAHALLKGRYSVIPEDITTMAFPVLRHRILMNYQSEFENTTADDMTQLLIDQIKVKDNRLS